MGRQHVRLTSPHPPSSDIPSSRTLLTPIPSRPGKHLCLPSYTPSYTSLPILSHLLNPAYHPPSLSLRYDLLNDRITLFLPLSHILSRISSYDPISIPLITPSSIFPFRYDLLNGRITLECFRGVVFCGGFSYADVNDSAKVHHTHTRYHHTHDNHTPDQHTHNQYTHKRANDQHNNLSTSTLSTPLTHTLHHLLTSQGWAGSIRFNESLMEQFSAFRDRPDTFSLGICNGCQV